MPSLLEEDVEDGDKPGLPGEVDLTMAITPLFGLLPQPPQLEQIPPGKLESSPKGEEECDPKEDTDTRWWYGTGDISGVGIGEGSSLIGERHLPNANPGTSRVIVGWLELALLKDVVEPASESGSGCG